MRFSYALENLEIETVAETLEEHPSLSVFRYSLMIFYSKPRDFQIFLKLKLLFPAAFAAEDFLQYSASAEDQQLEFVKNHKRDGRHAERRRER